MVCDATPFKQQWCSWRFGLIFLHSPTKNLMSSWCKVADVADLSPINFRKRSHRWYLQIWIYIYIYTYIYIDSKVWQLDSGDQIYDQTWWWRLFPGWEKNASQGVFISYFSPGVQEISWYVVGVLNKRSANPEISMVFMMYYSWCKKSCTTWYIYIYICIHI